MKKWLAATVLSVLLFLSVAEAVVYTYAPVEFDKFIAKPDKYQARGPNDETRKRMRLRQEEAGKCSRCIPEEVEDGKL